MARYRFATVCASTPCEASTTRRAPSQLISERRTSWEKSTCPGVSIRLSSYVLPSFAVYGRRDGVGLDRDPALALEVHGVEDLVAELPRLHRPAALDEAVGERRLAVVDVGDDAEVADVVHGPLCGARFGFEEPMVAR